MVSSKWDILLAAWIVTLWIHVSFVEAQCVGLIFTDLSQYVKSNTEKYIQHGSQFIKTYILKLSTTHIYYKCISYTQTHYFFCQWPFKKYICLIWQISISPFGEMGDQ